MGINRSIKKNMYDVEKALNMNPNWEPPKRSRGNDSGRIRVELAKEEEPVEEVKTEE